VETVRIDPRDQTWELDRPTYRVHFHDVRGASDEYEVREADVGEVLAWAEAECGGRTFVLYACVPTDGLGLVRLHGSDPNASLRRQDRASGPANRQWPADVAGAMLSEATRHVDCLLTRAPAPRPWTVTGDPIAGRPFSQTSDIRA